MQVGTFSGKALVYVVLHMHPLGILLLPRAQLAAAGTILAVAVILLSEASLIKWAHPPKGVVLRAVTDAGICIALAGVIIAFDPNLFPHILVEAL